MPTPVKPFVTSTRVAPVAPSGLKLDDRESPFFDSVGQEQHSIAGVSIDYYQLNPERSTYDALYGEPILRMFDGPFKLQSLFSFAEQQTATGKMGIEITMDGIIYIHRADVEEGRLPAVPRQNDVIHVWPTPFFDEFAVDHDLDLGSGLFYSVTNANPNGVHFDQPAFSGFKLICKRKLDMTPERLINGF